MKTTLLLKMASVSLLAASTFCACNKDKNDDGDKGTSAISGKITVKVDGGSDLDIDTVKLRLGSYVAYSTAYTNGEFTLEFPSVDDEYLYAVTGGLLDGITASDVNVKIDDADFLAYKSGNKVGSFYYGTTEWHGFPMYANGNVNITGKGTDEDGEQTFSVKLKKGWNFVYVKQTETASEYTTQAPDGAAWKYDKL